MATFIYGWGLERVSEEHLMSRSSWKSLDGRLQQRLLDMFRANNDVGVGVGYRSEQRQEQMFRERYVPDSNGSVSWNGQRWKRVKGATAAPPGRSMHEIGLACDLVGDVDWVQSNAARFKLKTFANVNSEPWHVQPVELPNSRRSYERAGSPWSGGATIDLTSPSSSDSGRAAPADEPIAPGGKARGPFKVGDRGDGVREIQQWLNDHDFDCGSVDGIFGPATERAVRRAQKAMSETAVTAYGGEVDGVWGPLTAGGALFIDTGTGALPSQSSGRNLSNGSKGPEVEAIQRWLNECGFDCGAADGIFGPKTEQAVRRAQEAMAATTITLYTGAIDGIWGPKTAAGAELMLSGENS